MKKIRIYYFAYGSNLNIFQMKRRCPESKLVCKAVLKGYQLLFSRYSKSWRGSVGDVMKNKKHNVWGLVYNITFDDLNNLDRFEGYPNLYKRKLVTVKLKNKTSMDLLLLQKI